MTHSGPQAIEELWKYDFIRFTRMHNRLLLRKAVRKDICLFVPSNRSIIRPLVRSDLDVHIMHRTDMIRYENDQHQCIAVVGVDVRLCSGFPEQRVLSLIEAYNLDVEDVCKLFSLRFSTSLASKFSTLRVFVITGLINSDFDYPSISEELTDLQATRIVQYISAFKELTPCLDMLKLTITRSEAALDALSANLEIDSPTTQPMRYTRKHFEQNLRMRSRELLSLCKRVASAICDCNDDLKNQHKSLHHFSYQLIANRVCKNTILYCNAEIDEFKNAVNAMKRLSMEEVGIPPLFRCNFRSAIQTMNDACYMLSQNPETMVPFVILQIWKRLLCDIRYLVNSSIARTSSLREDDLQLVAMSTNDLISIVCFLFLQLEHGDLIPAQLVIVDAFAPFDISTTAAGYAYGVVETAVMWICEYAASHKPS